MNKLTDDYRENTSVLRRTLDAGRNFDILEKQLLIADHAASLFFIDGLVKDDILEKLLEYFYILKPEDLPDSLDQFQMQNLPYIETEVLTLMDDVLKNLLSGVPCLFVNGMADCLAIDCRTYPARSVEEPMKDRTLRGSRDGFVETVVFNTALIRRRIRSPRLCMEMLTAGKSTLTDIVLCYMNDRVDRNCLEQLKSRIASVSVDALTMNQESLAELLLPGCWFNPFPKYHLTERPDTAAASVLEGNIVMLVDNSPSAIILPTSLFSIMEEANDYYFPPITGTYLRLSRFVIMVLSLILTPLFLLLMQHPEWIPESFQFIRIKDTINIPLIWQFLLLELAIDGLRLAAIHTPDMLSTPLSVIAGLVIGEFAVNSGWFNAEVMLYMAFVTIANYSQSNVELNYAVKFMRIMLLLLTCWFGLPGFSIGMLILFACLLRCRTFSGKGYLYPLIPFHWKTLKRQLFRVKL
ncbi:MAG: spore germination protein [Lachnospiraceae bacterium]|nr:spore germination protein [Lachnospiraceae bacterium]